MLNAAFTLLLLLSPLVAPLLPLAAPPPRPAAARAPPPSGCCALRFARAVLGGTRPLVTLALTMATHVLAAAVWGAQRGSAEPRLGAAARWALLAALFAGRCGAQTATRPAIVSTLAGSGAGAFANGVGAGASFYSPIGVAVDSSGNVIVADQGNNRIRKVTPGGVVTTLAGSGSPAFADGTGAGASFNLPHGVAVDSSGNVIVADHYNHRIRKVTPGGVVTTLAGSSGGAFADGTGAGASFYFPLGVAVDSSGNVIVADQSNHRIRKVTPGGVVTTLAGDGFGAPNAGRWVDGTGAGASFNYPYGVAVDSSGNVIVADTANQRIRKVTPGGVVTTLAGSGSYAFADGTGAGAAFNYPSGVAVDSSGNVIVADAHNHRIRKVTPGGVVTTLAGSSGGAFADGTGAGASFYFPFGVAVDSSGNVIVADAGNHRIRLIITHSLLCPAGFFCGSCFTEPTGVCPCPAGTYCPAGSSAPTPCPVGAPGLLISAASLSACYVASGGTSSNATSGSPCASNSSCPSGACRGGYCCTANAARQGCAVCAPPFGSCLLNSPGDACTTDADCGTNQCLGGCCCASSALKTSGCASCACWSAPSTTAATAGACNATAAVANVSLPCNASTAQTSSVALSRVISFPAAANVTGASPLVFLPAASPLNANGVDIIVASPSACAAFSANFAAAQCAPQAYTLSTGTYFYLGTAAALGMTATPSCAS